jgi:hypothetical protein
MEAQGLVGARLLAIAAVIEASGQHPPRRGQGRSHRDLRQTWNLRQGKGFVGEVF